jgi:pimeloyl-ACP methyl ester carboxylesterase
MADGMVHVRELNLAYQEWGASDGRECIVLVHGLGSSSHIWDLVGPQLATAGYRVLALDQRGHGESDQPDTGYDFSNIVADLLGFADKLGAREPVVLAGHSWGASVVLHFAAEHPERTAAIALVDGGTASPGERLDWQETLARLTPPEIDGLPWEDLRQRMARNNGVFQDPRVEAIGRSLFHIDAEGRVARRLKIPNHLRILRALWEQRPAELLPVLACPVLVLPARQASEASEWAAAKIVNVDRALALQPRARVRWFEDTIHDVPLQRPDELAAELRNLADEAFSAERARPASA